MEKKALLVILGFLFVIFGMCMNTPMVYAASSVNTVYLYDNAGTQIWSHSHSKWDSDYIRVDMPEDGLSVVAVNDDPADSPGCILCYWNHLKDGTSGWSTADGTPVCEFDPLGGPGDTDFYSVAISGNGDIIATGPSGGSFVLSTTCSVTQTLSMGTTQSYDLTLNGQFGACGNRGGEVWCFSKDSSTPLWDYSVGGIVHSVAIQSVTTPTDLILAAGSSNGYVYAFDETGELLWSYDADAVSGNVGGVVSVAMSDQGQYIAVGSYHDKLYLFNAAGSKIWEKQVPVSISWDGGWMGTESKSVAISADGQYIVAAGTDKLYLYNNAGTLIWSHDGEETCVAISPDGNYITACNYGGEVHLFSRTSSTPLWTKNINAFWGAVSDLGYVAVSARAAPPPPEEKDQYQENCEVCEHVDTYWISWQEFVPTANSLSRVEVKIARYEAYPNEYPITMTIESPLDNVLTSATLPWTVVPELPWCETVWISFDVPDIELTPGQSYYIVLDSEPLAYHWCAVDWDAYPPGRSNFEYPWDWTFRTFCLTEEKPVGGFWVPVDKLGLLSPYIGVASTILAATAATAIYAKRVKRRKKKQ